MYRVYISDGAGRGPERGETSARLFDWLAWAARAHRAHAGRISALKRYGTGMMLMPDQVTWSSNKVVSRSASGER